MSKGKTDYRWMVYYYYYYYYSLVEWTDCMHRQPAMFLQNLQFSSYIYYYIYIYIFTRYTNTIIYTRSVSSSCPIQVEWDVPSLSFTYVEGLRESSPSLPRNDLLFVYLTSPPPLPFFPSLVVNIKIDTNLRKLKNRREKKENME